ncbi:hypothetical protein KUCAC02_036582 [Chaenocephalus aceratus]|nr:hypothetical protein KUCAC02_036582 [Chaenocephalus aceratus]
MPPIDVTTLEEEEATPLMSQNEAFVQHLQQAALSPPLSSELLAADLPLETLSSPDRETPPQSQDPAVQNLEASPIPLDPEDTMQRGNVFSPLVPPQSSDQIHVSQASFPQNQLQVQSSVSQPPSPPQQHTQHKPTAALLVEPEAFSLQPPSPAAWGQGQGPPEPRERTPTLRSLQTCTKPADLPQRESLTPAARRHRFQQRLCSDQASVQASLSGPGFPSLQDAVSRLLPFHCAGELPTQQHFNTVDQEFETVSGFLLKRTKDMVNKYRQLLVREAQAERCALVEDRRRVRRGPRLSSQRSQRPEGKMLPSGRPPPRPLQEDPLLNEHLQSAIDSILELQRLQGPSGAPPPGPCLDQGVSSALQL